MRRLGAVGGILALAVVLAGLALGALPARASVPPTDTEVTLAGTPQQVAIDAAAGVAYVTDIGDNRVDVVTGIGPGQTPTVAGTITALSAFGVAVDPGLHLLYVDEYSGPDLTVIDTRTRSVVTTIALGSGPTGEALRLISVDPVTHQVWVPDFASGVVYQVDGTSLTLVRTVPVGANPDATAVDPSTHRVYVADRGADEVTVLDGGTGATLATVPLAYEARPAAVAVDDSTHALWVADASQNAVTEVDGTSDRVTATYGLGASPVSVAVDDQTHAAYVSAGSSLSVVEDGEVSSRVVGTTLDGIAEDPSDRVILATNSGPNELVQLGAQQSGLGLLTSVDPVASGQSLTYTAVVSPAQAGGSVSFFDNGAAIAACTAVGVIAPTGPATATCATTGGRAGLHQITAEYTGTASTTTSAATLDGGERVVAAPVAASVPAAGPGGGAGPPASAPAGSGASGPPAVSGSTPNASPAAAPTARPSTATTVVAPLGPVSAGPPPSTIPSLPGATALPPGPPAPGPAAAAVPGRDVATTFIDDVPSPSQGGSVAVQVGSDLLLAALLLALLDLPVAMVNQTAKHNAESLRALAAAATRGVARTPLRGWAERTPRSAALLVAAMLSGALYGFARPGATLNAQLLALVVGVGGALLAVNLLSWLPVAAYLHRRCHTTAGFRLFPGFAAVAVVTVLLSRLTGLQPGLVLGPLVSLTLSPKPAADDNGRARAIGLAFLGAGALAAWLLRGTLLTAVGSPGSFGPEVLGVLLTTVTLSGVCALTFDLVPMTFMVGADVWKWSKRAWALLATFATVTFAHIVLSAHDDGAGFARRITYLCVLLGFYLVAALAFWAWFRLRAEKPAASRGDIDLTERTEVGATR